MIQLVNKTTKTLMWVADNRADEYIAAGHSPVATPTEKPIEEEPKQRKGRKKEV